MRWNYRMSGNVTVLIQACVRGALFAFIGGLIWGSTSNIFGIRVDCLPTLSIGVLVGLGVRGRLPTGKRILSLIAALITLPACVIADATSLWGCVVIQMGRLPHRVMNWDAYTVLLRAYWRPIDVLVYAIAVAEAWQVAAHRFDLMPLRAILASTSLRLRQIVTLGVILFLFGLFFWNVHRTKIADVVLSSNGEWLAVAESGNSTSVENVIRLWNLKQHKHSNIVFQKVGRLAWADSSRFLAIICNSPANNGRDSGQVELWDVQQHRRVSKISHPHYLDCVAVDEHGGLLATGDRYGRVRVWSIPDFREITCIEHEQAVSSMAFSSRVGLLAVGLRDGTLVLREHGGAYRVLRTIAAHSAAITALQFDEAGKLLYSAGGIDSSVKVWHLRPLTLAAEFRVEFDWITDLTLSPDDKTLAVSGGSFHRAGAVLLLDRRTGEVLNHFHTGANTVQTSVFLDDGRTLLAGTTMPISPFSRHRKGELYRWNIESRRLLDALR